MKNEIVLYERLDGQCDTALTNVALSNYYDVQRGEEDEFPNYYKEHENSWGAQIPYIALGVLLSKLVDYVWPKVVSAVQGWLTPTQSDADSKNDSEGSDAGADRDSENVVTVSIGGDRDSMGLFVYAAYNVLRFREPSNTDPKNIIEKFFLSSVVKEGVMQVEMQEWDLSAMNCALASLKLLSLSNTVEEDNTENPDYNHNLAIVPASSTPEESIESISPLDADRHSEEYDIITREEENVSMDIFASSYVAESGEYVNGIGEDSNGIAEGWVVIH
ncbi:hypothetical protein [Candidatus Tisiphia endosymbiont of Beris chalybata]|uniref:hypothetical protein n=1 Tax=Candidatus Tisiphia endosymbiont of Beris chalybata TaxID=3066262 RepID=UPI00312CBC56